MHYVFLVFLIQNYYGSRGFEHCEAMTSTVLQSDYTELLSSKEQHETATRLFWNSSFISHFQGTFFHVIYYIIIGVIEQRPLKLEIQVVKNKL